MGGNAIKRPDACANSDLFTEQVDEFGTVQQLSSERTLYLIAHKEHRTFLPPQIVLEMVADPSRLAHTGCGNDHLGGFVHIDLARGVARHREMQPLKPDRVDSSVKQRVCLRIKIALQRVLIDAGGFDGKRAVQPDRKIDHAKPLFLDPAQHIEKLLRSADCKGWNDYIPAACEGAVNDLCKALLQIL